MNAKMGQRIGITACQRLGDHRRPDGEDDI